MAKFQTALKKANELLNGQVQEFKEDIEKGWINRDANKQYEVSFTLKFKEKEGGDIQTKSDISFVTDKTRDAAEALVTDQEKLL